MYAVLYLAHFPLQAVLRTEPDAQGRAAALFADNTKKSIVLAVNPRAGAAGVELGMTAPQAVARCPALVIRTPSPAAEADACAALLAVGFTLSPLIEDTAPGVCTIDLKGTDPRQHEPTASSAVRQLQELGFAAAAGIAPTPLLALYAARAAAADTTEIGRAMQPELFQLADEPAPYPTRDRMRDQHGVRTITDPTSFLGPLPLSAADPTPEMATILGSWGLRTLGDLAALSRDDIGRRLGPDGLALWDRAGGGAARPLHPAPSPRIFAATMEFEDEIETLEPLLFILRRFLERLTLELRTSGYVAAELALTLSLADDSQHGRSFRLPDPTADLEVLFRTLQTHLDSLRTEAAILAVSLQIEPTRPLVRQQGLFDTGLRDPHGFSETLARIVAIVGSDRVGTPQLEDTHRPDAVRLMPPFPVIPPAADPPIHAPCGPPLRRYRPPLRAQLEFVDGRPTYLWTESFQGAVTAVRGPWLSSGEWWQPDRAWRRTEYDVAIADGGVYRLVYASQDWLIDGVYD